MKVVLVAPFVMSRRIDLAAFVADDPHRRCAELSQRPFGGWKLQPAAAADRLALIDHHQPGTTTLVPGRILSAVLAPGADPELVGPGVQRVELTVGAHGVAALLLWCDATVAQLASIESSACRRVAPIAEQLSAFLGANLPHTSARDGDARYRVDNFLWWHRVVYGGDLRRYARDMVGGVHRDLGSGRAVTVADGYTTVSGASDEDVVTIVDGIVDAQQLWIVSELSAREAITQIATLQVSADPEGRGLDKAADQASDAADAALLRSAVVAEQVRYTAGIRRATLDAAVEAWDLSLDVERANGVIAALQRMLERRAGRRTEHSQRRVAFVVFLLTVVSSFGLLLTFFDTATGPVIESHALRIAVALAVFVLAVVTGVALLVHVRRRK